MELNFSRGERWGSENVGGWRRQRWELLKNEEVEGLEVKEVVEVDGCTVI